VYAVAAPSPLWRTLAACVACLAWAAMNRDSTIIASQSPPPFQECEPRRGQHWTYANLICLRQAGTTHNAQEEVIRHLRALGAEDTEHPWATLVLAHVRLDQLQRHRAMELYERAAEGFARSRDAEGEVIARQNLANQYRLRGDAETAGRHVAKAVAAAEASQRPLIVARAAVIEAVHSMATGGDIGRAYRVLLRADRLLSSEAPIGLRRTILFNLGSASLHLGQIDRAIDALERHQALHAEDGSRQSDVSVQFNLLVARLARDERRPSPRARERLVANAESVLSDAKKQNEPLVVTQAHRVLGDLMASSDADRAALHLQSCLDVEAALGFPSLRAACLWSLSRLESTRDHRRADALSDKALSLLDTHHDSVSLAHAWQSRLRLVWRTLPEDAAIVQSYEALDAIERLRSSQAAESSRAGLFGNWARDYQWLTGQLLQAREPRLAQAFQVGERLRSRVLLERMAQADRQNLTGSEREATIEQVGRRIAATQRQLLSTPLAESKRRTLLGQLRLLELEREDLNEGDVRALPPHVAPPTSINAVQRLLDEQEAMVWFSIAPWKDVYDEFGGGSWAVTITRHAAAIHRLVPGDDLDAQVAALIGLLRERRGRGEVWTPAARRLGETLLGNALAHLPPTITRLVIVTDGALHRLPFEILTLPSGPMLGERFDISEVPSATLWVRMRESHARPPGGGVLVLADPDVPQGSPDGGRRLESLPGARREADAIVRILDLDRRHVAQGPAASERLVKTAALGTLSILHVAAHARADAAFPERSAVFVAPGDASEDGWLQPNEIAALDLQGRLVVLSACDSAAGAVLPGEGPLSLARAFFSAGARGVVATRWPLRDDDAAFMMERFYTSLASGQSVGAALRQARRDAIAHGLPAAAWAGIIGLGDGLQQPITPRPPHRSHRTWIGGIVIVMIVGTTLWSRRRRRFHQSSDAYEGVAVR
jgi:tetratricopeptide (TPR) repeat protein